MATREAVDGYIPLRDTLGDARRVQMILAEWGMDEATISRMFAERKDETERFEEVAREHGLHTTLKGSRLAH